MKRFYWLRFYNAPKAVTWEVSCCEKGDTVAALRGMYKHLLGDGEKGVEFFMARTGSEAMPKCIGCKRSLNDK